MAKAVTLKNGSNEEVYPVTDLSLVNGNIPTNRIVDEAVTATKTNLATFKNNSDVADSFGWTYLGQTIITSPTADIIFTTPTKYDNYKVIMCAALATGSSTWADVRMLDGATNLYNYHHVQQASGTSFSAGINSNVVYCANGISLNQYDGIDAEVNIYGAGANWIKFHGIFCAGQNNGFSTRIFNGRNNSATQPDTFELITGGTFNTGSWIKVWGSNNPAV